ncbi:MAG: multiheme c-type cytochrome [Planctomycetota bacterium]
MSQRTLARGIRAGLPLLVGVALLAGGCPGLQWPLPTPGGDDGEPRVTTGNSGLTGKYIGPTRCGDCHRRMHQNWSATAHHGALETLEAIGQGTNAQCLPCHTVGFGESGGFVDRATTNELAGVSCESCHGAGGDHVNNIEDDNLRPKIDLASAMCGRCHTGAHHPTFDEWGKSGHAIIDEHVSEGFAAGSNLTSCGACHSGDYFYRVVLNGETVGDTLLQGKTPDQMLKKECALCHDPHRRTGNAAQPAEGRDYQLRFAEVAFPSPSLSRADAMNTARFNLCGQCHHSRGRVWTDNSRGPHHSLQANVYIGEMPMPDGAAAPLVPPRVSVHSFAPKQCTTCHMHAEEFVSEEVPAETGHSFHVNYSSCAAAGCHPSAASAEAIRNTLKAEVEARAARIVAALGPAETWEYTSSGGPGAAAQPLIPASKRQARFLMYYALNDSSYGIHNPAYVRDLLSEAERLANLAAN